MIQGNFWTVDNSLKRERSRRDPENEIKDRPGSMHMSMNFQNTRSKIKILNPPRVKEKVYRKD